MAGWRQARETKLEEQRRKQHADQLLKEQQARKAKAAGEARLKQAAKDRLNALDALSKSERRRLNEKLRASRDFTDDSVEVKPEQPQPQPKPAFRPAGSFNSLARTGAQQSRPARGAAASVSGKVKHGSRAAPSADNREQKPTVPVIPDSESRAAGSKADAKVKTTAPTR